MKTALVVGDGSKLAVKLALMMRECAGQVYFAGQEIPEELHTEEHIHVVPFVIGNDTEVLLRGIRNILHVLPRITHFVHCAQPSLHHGSLMKWKEEQLFAAINAQLISPMFFLKELYEKRARAESHAAAGILLEELMIVTTGMKHEMASQYPVDAMCQAALRALAWTQADFNRGFEARQILHVEVELVEKMDNRLTPSWVAGQIDEYRLHHRKDNYRKAIQIRGNPGRVAEVKIHD